MINIVPKGYFDIREAFDQLGRAEFEDAWTGEELKAQKLPSPDEIRRAHREAAERYEEWKRDHGGAAYSRAIPGKPLHFEEVNPFEDKSLPDPEDENYLAERKARERRDATEFTLVEHLYNGKLPAHRKAPDGKIDELASHIWQAAGFKFALSSGTASWKDAGTTYRGHVLVKQADLNRLLEPGEVVHLRGRSSFMPKVEQELRRRVQCGELLPTMYQEARYLADWAERAFPQQQTPVAKTIENRLGSLYRDLRNDPASQRDNPES